MASYRLCRNEILFSLSVGNVCMIFASACDLNCEMLTAIDCWMAECNCFGHADACVYNETVAERHLSINIHGVYEGGGVCIDCQVSCS